MLICAFCAKAPSSRQKVKVEGLFDFCDYDVISVDKFGRPASSLGASGKQEKFELERAREAPRSPMQYCIGLIREGQAHCSVAVRFAIAYELFVAYLRLKNLQHIYLCVLVSSKASSTKPTRHEDRRTYQNPSHLPWKEADCLGTNSTSPVNQAAHYRYPGFVFRWFGRIAYITSFIRRVQVTPCRPSNPAPQPQPQPPPRAPEAPQPPPPPPGPRRTPAIPSE